MSWPRSGSPGNNLLRKKVERGQAVMVMAFLAERPWAFSPSAGWRGPTPLTLRRYRDRSSDRMSTVTMNPVVPRYVKAFSPVFHASTSVGIILKPLLRGTPK